MITLYIQVATNPDSQQAFIQEVNQLADKLLSQKKCEVFQLSLAPQDPNQIKIFESWSSAESFKEYEESEEYKEFINTIRPMLAGAPNKMQFLSEIVS